MNFRFFVFNNLPWCRFPVVLISNDIKQGMFKSDNRESYSLFLSCNDSEWYCLSLLIHSCFEPKSRYFTAFQTVALTLCVLNIHYLSNLRVINQYQCICSGGYHYALLSQRIPLRNRHSIAMTQSRAFQQRLQLLLHTE